ncbi:uncharacterized protein MYCGRDRAFT_104725, partial [Zymoseptoria tritici IPO323]
YTNKHLAQHSITVSRRSLLDTPPPCAPSACCFGLSPLLLSQPGLDGEENAKPRTTAANAIREASACSAASRSTNTLQQLASAAFLGARLIAKAHPQTATASSRPEAFERW